MAVQIVMAPDAGPVSSDRPVEQKLGALELAWRSGLVRKTCLVILLGVLWQAYATYLDNPLLFPTLSDTLQTGWERIVDGTLPARVLVTVKVLLIGYVTGTLLAGLLTVLAINTRIGTDVLETLTAMFNPLRRSPCCRWR